MTYAQITTIRNTLVTATMGIAILVPLHGLAASGGDKPPSSMSRPTLQPSDLPSAQFPDPKVKTVSATCKPGQSISANVTIENVTGVPTAKQIKTKVRVFVPKSQPSKNSPPPAPEVIVLGVHTTAAGFTGSESFPIQSTVPYYGYPHYKVKAILSISMGEQEVTGANNYKQTHINCSW